MLAFLFLVSFHSKMHHFLYFLLLMNITSGQHYQGGFMLKAISLIAFASLIGTTGFAKDKITNFSKVDLFSFECGPLKSGQKDVTGAEWNQSEAILRLFTTNDVLEFEVTRVFKGLLTQKMVGTPIDGSKGSLEFMLRDQTATTVVLNGYVSYLNCVNTVR